VVSGAVCPEWVPSGNCLTNVGASDSGIAMQPSINFHHLSSRKFPPLVLNQACSFEAYCGLHLDKGHGNKASASEAEVCPPVSAALLAFLSAFEFPQTPGVSPFWCPQQCTTVTLLGAHTAFSNFRIFCPYLTLFIWVRSPDWQWSCF
jgi:hypothetical protein